MSYDLTRPLARGRTSEVFASGDGRVLKLYLPGWPDGAAEREHWVAKKLNEAGVPAPAVFGVERVNGRSGVVYERVDGPSMLDLLAARPWTFASHARRLAELHAQVHARTVPGLRVYGERLRADIGKAASLDAARNAAALRLLDSLLSPHPPEGDKSEGDGRARASRSAHALGLSKGPVHPPHLPGEDRPLSTLPLREGGYPPGAAGKGAEGIEGNSLCHGDFHPANVILSPKGPVIIDWADASSGDPLADVARTVVLLRFGPLAEPDPVRRTLFRTLGFLFLGAYLRHYKRLTGGNEARLMKWLTVSAAARLGHGITEERAALMTFVRRRLKASHLAGG
jgi:hypothetical protein